MILPALVTFPNPAAQECFCQLWMACAAIRRKCWPALTYTPQALTHTFTLSPGRIAFLQTTHLMSLSLSVLLPWQQLTVQRYSCAEQILRKNWLFLLTVHKAIDCALWPLLIATVTHRYLRAELRLRGILEKTTTDERRLTVNCREKLIYTVGKCNYCISMFFLIKK